MAHHGRSAQRQVIRPNTLYTCVTDHFQNHGPLQHNDIIVPVNAMISSCCEVRDDIVGHDHMIRALL